MSFSTQWEETYQANQQLSIWPWSDLVSTVMRYVRPSFGRSAAEISVLELGCGAGANIPFFRRLGVQYHAIDGSRSAVDRLHQTYPELAATIKVADFTKKIPFDGPFDLIVDRASLTHNSTAAITQALQLVWQKLVPGTGKYVGIDLFSTDHSAFQDGQPADDNFTREHFESDHFKGIGKVHFFNEKHLREALANFSIEMLQHKTTDQLLPVKGRIAAWNVVASTKK